MSWTRSLAWPLWALVTLLCVSAFALLFLTRDVALPESFGFRGATAIVAAAASMAAILILGRRPSNRIGWLLLLSGFSGAVEAFANLYATYALVAHPGTLPLGDQLAWLQSWAYVPLVGTVVYILLLFPTGRLASPQWRAVALLVPVSVLMYAGGEALTPGPLNNLPVVVNPVRIPDSWIPWTLAAGWLGYALAVAVLAAGALSFVLRFRRSNTEERAQLRWIAFATVWLGVAVVPSTSIKLFEYLAIAGFCALDAAIVIAILRYRLYDIDLLINRTIVYGATSATLAVAFFAGLVALQPVLRPLTSGSEVEVAAATLASFALFQPVRRRVQDAVDRRFDRARYDAARTLDQFADRLRDEVDIDALRSDLLSAVNGTMAPMHSSLWLRG